LSTEVGRAVRRFAVILRPLSALPAVVFLSAGCAARDDSTEPPSPTETPIAEAIDGGDLFAGSPTPVETRFRPADGKVIVFVPEGEFLMGSAADDPQADPIEVPEHTVYLDAFWIDRTETTNAQ
jgi:formylglycine-generating enzyme required for sulfatase activity